VTRELGFHVCLYGFLFSGPAAVGDTALYYIWRDGSCLTADKGAGGTGGWAFMFACTVFCFSSPVAVGDSGLHYVLCDKGCLTVDRALVRVLLTATRSTTSATHEKSIRCLMSAS
jgi:hypothetical protein